MKTARSWRVLSACLGLAAGLGGAAALRVGVAIPDRTVALWVADRDGARVVGLGSDFDVFVEVALPAPTLVRAAPAGGVWVVAGPQAQTVAFVDPAGDIRYRHTLAAPALDMIALRRGALVLLREDGDSPNLLRLGAAGRTLEQVRLPGAQALRVARCGVWVDGADGLARRFDVEPHFLLREIRAFDRGVTNVAERAPFVTAFASIVRGDRVVWALRGGLVELEPGGRPVRSQGGFDYLVDVSGSPASGVGEE